MEYCRCRVTQTAVFSSLLGRFICRAVFRLAPEASNANVVLLARSPARYLSDFDQFWSWVGRVAILKSGECGLTIAELCRLHGIMEQNYINRERTNGGERAYGKKVKHTGQP